MKGAIGAAMPDVVFNDEKDICCDEIPDDDWDDDDDDEIDEDELCVYCGDKPRTQECPDCGELTICKHCQRADRELRCERCLWLDVEMPETDDAIDVDELFEDTRDELLHADGMSMLLNNE